MSNIFGFDVKWKYIVIGFYFVRNEIIVMYNLFLFFVVLKIYKYKMFCRLESFDEIEYNLRNYVKKCIIFWINVLKFSKCDLRIDVIENVI